MGAIVELRQTPLSAAEQGLLWRALADDATLADLPYKIETDRWGGLRMSPARNEHSRVARTVSKLLESRLGGEAITEVAILTHIGVKVADVAWCSERFMAQSWNAEVLTRAPEICVEIVSPSNSRADMLEKVAAYLAVGAVEVWLVSQQGVVAVHTVDGESDSSGLLGARPADLGLTPNPG
jgi:Putative restriction endonuclease